MRGTAPTTAAALLRPFDPGSSDQGADLRVLGVAMAAGAAVVPLLPDVGTICPLRRLTGVPCPFCGMTTGTLALGEGDLAGSVAANPGAIMLVVAIMVAFVPPLYRSGPLRQAWQRIRPIAPALPFVVLPLLWLWELNRFAFI